jgi:hypothetical protein
LRLSDIELAATLLEEPLSALPGDYPEQIMTVLRAVLLPEIEIDHLSPRSMTVNVRRDGLVRMGGVGYPFRVPGGLFLPRRRVTAKVVGVALEDAIDLCADFMENGEQVWKERITGSVRVDVRIAGPEIVATIRGSEAGLIELMPVYMRGQRGRDPQTRPFMGG